MSAPNTKAKVIIGISKPTDTCIEHIKNQVGDRFNIKIVQSNDKSPVLYNKIIRSESADIYGFIDGTIHLNQNCIEEVVKKFEWSTEQMTGAIFTDSSLVNPDSKISSNQYYFSYSLSKLRKYIINPPIFINGGIMTPIFNEELAVLYYYDALLKISSNSMIYHIPKNLMQIENTPKDASNDLRIIQNGGR